MKKRNSIRNKYSDGQHSFLFWLVIPSIMLWLSVSYFFGMIHDKPLWFDSGRIEGKTDANNPYFLDYGTPIENLHQPFISIWFDDAWISQYLQAYPILKKYNFPGVMAVPVKAIETAHYMNWAQLHVIQDDGWEISNHSLVHDCNMQTWNKGAIDFEYLYSKSILWQHHLTSNIFVTPCGVDSSIMRDEAAKNFIGYRTVDPGFNDPLNFNPYNLKVKNIDAKVGLQTILSWIDEAKKTSSWLILVFHKIGEQSGNPESDEFNTSVADFQAITNYIHTSQISVVVPYQIIMAQAYVKQKK